MTNQKIALVTGANRGLGLETATQLARQGMLVLLTARHLADAQEAAKSLQEQKLQIIPHALDVTQDDDIYSIAAFITQEYGRLDVLVNNAGVFLEDDVNANRTIFRQCFDINTIGPYLLTEALLPLLQKSPAARIVNVSSYHGSINRHTHNDVQSAYPAYAAAKAALNILTIIHANKLSHTNAKVNAAHPGRVQTRMYGPEADLSVEEGAQTALWLTTLPDDGPTGGFFHKQEKLPW